MFDGIALLGVIAGLICLYLTFHYLEWRHHDRERRSERLVHRTMQRIVGQS